ncbi:unnamed protein product [Mytilus coruscus]|uniref:Uncharacterized protein n=1 Tax=Mytilus coruscus TaxID=42192 RepID=A0A6J7ZUU8_MYTCO|nr:unnamed protein product [Mytilus coruscus]
MKTSAIVAVLLVHIYLANGHSYRYNRNKKVFRSKVKKRVLKDFLHKKSSGPCPPVACDQEFIPDECRMKTYFFKNGYKCQGCDNNKCSKKIKELKRLVKRTIKVVEIHGEKEERRPSIRDRFPDMSVRTPFDNVHRSGIFPESSVRLTPDSIGSLGSLSDSSVQLSPDNIERLGSVRLPQDNIRRRGSFSDLSVRLPPNNIESAGSFPDSSVQLSPNNIGRLGSVPDLSVRLHENNFGSRGSFPDSSIRVSQENIRNQESLLDNSLLLRQDNILSRGPLADSSVRLFQDNVEPLSPFPGSSVGLPADSVGPNDPPVAPPVARPVSPLPAARPDSPPPAARPDFPPPAARPVSPPPAALPISPPVQPIITSDVGQQRRDPLTVLDAPPSDNEFVNRVRFDSSNANLLQPPADSSLTENIQNPLINPNTMQNPFLQNIPAPLQGQPNNNLWPQTQGFMPQNLQGGGQSPEMQLLQNQQILDQLRGQQAALEFQIQQLRGQQQAPTFGQFQMPQFPIGGIPQTQQGLPNNGIPANFQGFPANGVNQNLPGQGFPGFVPQGFPGFGQNTNPFMAGMQQPAPNQNSGLNPNSQMSQFLNQLPPVPGINSNFQGQVPLNGNFQGQVPLNGNFQGQAPLNGNFLGPTLTAANPLGSVQGFANQGQSNVQTSNTGGFVDPVTNQALPASSNSLHGPVTQP